MTLKIHHHPLFAPLVAFLDLRHPLILSQDRPPLNPKFFCSALFGIYRILILNLTRNKIHLTESLGQATSKDTDVETILISGHARHSVR